MQGTILIKIHDIMELHASAMRTFSGFTSAAFLKHWFEGGAYITSSMLLKGVRHGGMVQFHSSTRVRRVVWVSADFAECHADLFELLTKAVAMPRSNWSMLEGQVDDFFAESRKRRDALTVIALVSDLEKGLDLFKTKKNAFSPTAFLDFITKFKGRITGACGE